MAKISFDPDDLTIGEMCDFEDISGVPIGAMQAGSVSTRMLLAMVYITERRANPAFTLEDAKRVRISDVDMASANPTEPASLGTFRAPAKPKARAKAS